MGLMHYDLAGYKPGDIEVACAFDIDSRKVERPLEDACFAMPNNTITVWRDLPKYGVTVDMGEIHDGVAEHMSQYPPESSFLAGESKSRSTSSGACARAAPK